MGGKPAYIAAFLPRTGWSLDRKGYLIYTSRKKGMNIRRGEKAHRLTIKHLAGVAELDPEWHVHHQDNWKANNAPENLIYAPACFNPSCARRDPYTGEYMSIEDWVRRYGAPAPSSVEDTPDWVFAMSNHIESEHYVE